MFKSAQGQLIRLVHKSGLARDIQGFVIDRQARGLSPRTIEFYSEELHFWQTYLERQAVQHVEDISPRHLREYLLKLGAHSATVLGRIRLLGELQVLGRDSLRPPLLIAAFQPLSRVFIWADVDSFTLLLCTFHVVFIFLCHNWQQRGQVRGSAYCPNWGAEGVAPERAQLKEQGQTA